MLTLLWLYDPLRAFAAGLLYMLLYAVGSRAVWVIKHWLFRRSTAGAIRLRRWQGWPFVGQVSSLVLALVFPLGMLITGVFAAVDVGLQPTDWPAVLPWVAGITAGATAWLALLWGVYIGRDSRYPYGAEEGSPTEIPGMTTSRVKYQESLANTVLLALRHEAAAATCRGALIPLLGPYWGIWLAVLWKMLISRTNPFTAAGLQRTGQREMIFLDWALDWVGAALFAFSGSVWAALAGRIICRMVVRLALGCISRSGRPAAPYGLADDQGQDNQNRKTTGSQNAETSQVT